MVHFLSKKYLKCKATIPLNKKLNKIHPIIEKLKIRSKNDNT